MDHKQTDHLKAYGITYSNLKKGNKLISQTNMQLLKKPSKPSYIYQLQTHVNNSNKSWKPYLFMDKN